MTQTFWDELSFAAFRENAPMPAIDYDGYLPGPLYVTELLSETTALAGMALARLTGRSVNDVSIDGRLCAFWGLTSCQPIGWTPAEPWDAFSAIFEGADGWIRLHTNASHHKAAALSVLGAARDKDTVARQIADLPVEQLEEQVVAAGGAAAQLISWNNWQNHPQGQAIARTPLVEWTKKPGQASRKLQDAEYRTQRPLEDIRVLDLTRVLAGPVATRTLAGFGAQVLRIDPELWDDPGLLQDTTIGKLCATLDLTASTDRERFEQLLKEADILVHGYRPGALAGLGYDEVALDRINPARIDVSLSAYGWSGPWASRRGFDSLVQFSAGIADLCGDPQGNPGKLPVQALDHATGYIMAACCLEALRLAQTGQVMSARTSLARIAWLLCQKGAGLHINAPVSPMTSADFIAESENSDLGELKRLRPPLTISGVPMHWNIPSGALRRHPAQWETTEKIEI